MDATGGALTKGGEVERRSIFLGEEIGELQSRVTTEAGARETNTPLLANNAAEEAGLRRADACQPRLPSHLRLGLRARRLELRVVRRLVRRGSAGAVCWAHV